MAASAASSSTGPAASLVAPDVVRLKVAGLTLSGRLAVAPDGSIGVVVNGSTIRLVDPDPSLPFHLTGLSVTSKALELRGTLDVGVLMR